MKITLKNARKILRFVTVKEQVFSFRAVTVLFLFLFCFLFFFHYFYLFIYLFLFFQSGGC